VTNRNSFGLTLTYDNDHLPPDASLVKRDYQLFLMRFRKCFSAYKIKYLLVGEYGDKSLRPHFHLVVFGIPLTILNGNFSINPGPLHLSSVPGSNRLYSCVVSDLWPYGFNMVGPAGEQCMRYVSGYVQKKQYRDSGVKAYDDTGRIPPFLRVSQGMGKDWCLANADSLRQSLCIPFGRFRLPIPRYFRKLLGIEAKDYIDSLADSYLESFDLFMKERFVTSLSSSELLALTDSASADPAFYDPALGACAFADPAFDDPSPAVPVPRSLSPASRSAASPAVDYPLVLPEGVGDVRLYLKRLISRHDLYKHLTPEYKAYVREQARLLNRMVQKKLEVFSRGTF
jgi:hypothetical protein